jgi:hypothetical protein
MTANASRAVDGSSRTLLALFMVTIFLAAALLFLVQPMVGKMVLPRLGGSPEVWNTSMVFFQLSLLGGYLYAHWSVSLLGTTRQAVVHAGLLVLPLLVLPIALPAWSPPAAGMESPWLLALLVAAVGGPFVALATASPLIQRWFAGTGHPAAEDPYFLYAASNAGSLLGLLAYPFVLEPYLPLAAQSAFWAWGYGAFVVLSGACAVAALRGARERPHVVVDPPAAERASGRLALRQRAFWVACAFVPSCLLMGATHYLTTDVAPIPLLWVVPLSVYLGTYVAAFSRNPPAGIAALSRWMSVGAVALTLMLLARVRDPVWVVLLLHLGVLAIVGLLCHTRLADARPGPSRLTEFYVFVAVGGVLGGAFAALAGPRLFDDLLEYPIAIVLACLLRVSGGDEGERGWRVADVALPAGLGLFVVAVRIGANQIGELTEGPYVLLTAVLPTVACFFFAPRRVRFALGIAVLLAFGYLTKNDRGVFLHAERTFFGVHRVTRDPAGLYTVLHHGSTIHGVQSTDPARAREALGYYHATGPGGEVVRALAERVPESRIALVGLGAGALAALTGPRQHVTVFEIDQAVVDIAEDERWFSYLDGSPAPYDVVVGDGRIALAREGPLFDLIVLDAFSSAAVPLHLLTTEAISVYLGRLAPGGALLFHVSNQHLELAPVLGAIAREQGLAAIERVDVRPPEEEDVVFGSHWVLMARRPEELARFIDGRWLILRADADDPAWTDDFSNVLSVFRWP